MAAEDGFTEQAGSAGAASPAGAGTARNQQDQQEQRDQRDQREQGGPGEHGGPGRRDREGPHPPQDPYGGYDPEDDALLTVRAAEGDEGAFEQLVRRHGPGLLRLATRLLGDRADAEDAVQESFVSAWRRLPEFRGQAAFRTWMYRIVTNRCLNVLRARKPVAPLESVAEPQAPDHQGSPIRAAESAAAAEAVSKALAGLSAEQRACWVLRELHGFSYDEIAETVGTSHQAVRGRIHRARRALMEAMAAWR